jgi:hypothetical protein
MRAQARACALITATLLTACGSKPLPDTCYEKPASGNCRAAHTRFFYNPDSARCEAFIWGGCGGNVPFETLEDCAKTCGTDQQGESVSGGKGKPATSINEKQPRP